MPGTKTQGGRAPSDRPENWIAAVAHDRDCDSFRRLFDRFAPKVKSYFRRMGLDEDSADELTQEAMLTLWRKADLFDPSRASVWGWTFTIARNLWIDRVRHERHPDDLCMPPRDDTPPTPEQEYCALENDARLRGAIDTLPLEQSEVVQLAFFEDRSHSEIADRLKLPLGTVKSRIRRAALRLRTRLDG